MYLQIVNIYLVMTARLTYSIDVVDRPVAEQPALFIKKLDQCCILFNFDENITDAKAKEVKRACLNELVEHITVKQGVLTDAAYPKIVRMVWWHTFLCEKQINLAINHNNFI